MENLKTVLEKILIDQGAASVARDIGISRRTVYNILGGKAVNMTTHSKVINWKNKQKSEKTSNRNRLRVTE